MVGRGAKREILCHRLGDGAPDTAPPVGAQPKTQSARAYDAIRRMILEWDLAPGQVIDERALMAEVAVGRTPIREALLRLSEQGLVAISPNRDIRVAPLDLNVIKELYEVRLQLDRLSARLFLASATATEREEVLASFDGADDLIARGDQVSVLECDFRFHRLIYTHAHNRFLTILHHNLTGQFFRIACLTCHLDAEAPATAMRELVDSHAPIIAAIRSNDEAALDAAITAHTTESFLRVREVTTRDRLDLVAGLQVEPLHDARRAASAAHAANNLGMNPVRDTTGQPHQHRGLQS